MYYYTKEELKQEVAKHLEKEYDYLISNIFRAMKIAARKGETALYRYKVAGQSEAQDLERYFKAKGFSVIITEIDPFCTPESYEGWYISILWDQYEFFRTNCISESTFNNSFFLCLSCCNNTFAV